MRRIVEEPPAPFPDRTLTRIVTDRYAEIMLAVRGEPPAAGVLSAYPIAHVRQFLTAGYVDVDPLPGAYLLRKAATRAVLATLDADADTLSVAEHALLERVLISGGTTALLDLPDLTAAIALQHRLWADVGRVDGNPTVRLDPMLEQPLLARLQSPEHSQIRARIFPFDAMVHALLYIAGYLDARLLADRFISDVLDKTPDAAATRLAQNFLESSYDVAARVGCRLLVHPALDDLSVLFDSLEQKLPVTVTKEMLDGAMNGCLPQEAAANHAFQAAVQGVLPHGIIPAEFALDMRLLAKQGVPIEEMLICLENALHGLPTKRQREALVDVYGTALRWLPERAAVPTEVRH